MRHKKYPRDLNACLEESPLAQAADDAAADLFAFVNALPSGECARTLRSLQSTVGGIPGLLAEALGCRDADMQLCRFERARLRALRCEGSAGVLRKAGVVSPDQLKALLGLAATLTRAITALCESVAPKVEAVVVERPRKRPRGGDGRGNGAPSHGDHGVQDEVASGPAARTGAEHAAPADGAGAGAGANGDRAAPA
jgi:hypothetical protein